MEAINLTAVILPLALFFVMLGVGMTLKISRILDVIKRPRVLFVGVLAQLLWLPILGYLVVSLFQLPVVIAVGLMVLCFAPGGATSNIITLLAKGDTALSVTLTAITSLVTPLTLPLFTAIILTQYGVELQFQFSVIETMMKLVMMTVVPILIGMMIHQKFPDLCDRCEVWVKRVSMLFLLMVVVMVVKNSWHQLPELLALAGFPVILLVLSAILSGFFIGNIMRVDQAQKITLGIEIGIQNAATAIVVTGVVLGSAEMSAVALLYGVLMNIPVIGLILLRADRKSLLRFEF